MAHLAALTKRIRIGTSVLIIPYRNPVVTAKMLATMDVLSGGRIILGAGWAGWRRSSRRCSAALLQGARAGHRRVHPPHAGDVEA